MKQHQPGRPYGSATGPDATYGIKGPLKLTYDKDGCVTKAVWSTTLLS
ncbi:MAG: hypothetical protein ACLU38_04675 [Dysosmobacter sp.]